MALLDVADLKTVFHTEHGALAAVDGVSFRLDQGEVLGLVGESGSGKSVTAYSLMRLIAPPGEITEGAVRFAGRDLLRLSAAELRRLRGNDMAMVFQEPMSSLNPLYSVGSQIAEPLVLHKRLSRRAAYARAVELLEMVGVPYPAQRVGAYPHQLSGGLRQRVMIAIALACEPQLLIADEPTTALDVTIQAQILDLLRRLRREFGMAIILITHDLGVVTEFTDRVLVMYAGRIVEQAAVQPLFERPRHPYAEALLRSIPSLESDRRRLETIEGTVPSPLALPPGCRFAPRCRYARAACDAAEPGLYALAPGHRAACIREFDYAFPRAADG